MVSLPRGAPTAIILSLALTACGNRDVQERLFAPRTVSEAGASDASAFAVTIHHPRWLEAISTRDTDPFGRPVEVRCETCHATQTFRLPDSPANLRGPHAAMRFEHGTNQCASCHDPAQFNRLRLATGESIAMTSAMQLCAQCHGPQARDYQHGAHGGMSGYWDLQRGPRLRNHCADCHDSHAPKFPQFTPAPPPRDLPTSHAPVGGSHG